MGDEAERLASYDDPAIFEDEEGFVRPNDEQEWYDDRRGQRLVRGFHVTANGQEMRLTAMKDSHLRNTIRFAGRIIQEKGPAARYWQLALPYYEREQLRRKPLAQSDKGRKP